jgi:hypothetical protein
MRPRLDHVARFVEVKLARAAIIEQAIGQIDRLLDLEHGQPRPERVDRPGGIVDEVAGRRPAPVEQVDDRPVPRRGDDLVAARLADRADAELGIVGDVEDDPAFVLAARIAARLRGGVVGVDLDRQPLGR